jgi:hypothetical protein
LNIFDFRSASFARIAPLSSEAFRHRDRSAQKSCPIGRIAKNYHSKRHGPVTLVTA